MNRRDIWAAVGAGLLLLLAALAAFTLWQLTRQQEILWQQQQTQTRKLEATLHTLRQEHPWREHGLRHYGAWRESGFASPADPLRFDECLDRMRQRFGLNMGWQFQSAYALQPVAGYRLQASPVRLEARGATLDELLAGIRYLNHQSCALVILHQADLSSDAEGPRLQAQLAFIVVEKAPHGP